MPSISNLISIAQQLLTKYPYDEAHDLSHHQRVWDHAKNISRSEKSYVDMDALKVACYWHDVVLEPKTETESRHTHINETLDYLSSLMQEQGYSPKFQKTVTDAIKDHGFEKKQQLNTEGELLFDADKLDALNPERYRALITAIKNKKLSKFKLFIYKNSAKLWLPTMRNRYHFETSKHLHDEKIEQLLADKETIRIANDIGIDIPNLVK